ncbi:MAG: hypothetical protein QF824_02685 [Candidatus Woesearchaeota archaeon]|jgi:hypothetical protein|nr:hypothetical protein [Candidatus Woesearchaeota archaeon]
MKENKSMFWIGITMIVITGILLLTVKGDLGGWTFMGLLGIIFMGASKYRPLVSKK